MQTTGSGILEGDREAGEMSWGYRLQDLYVRLMMWLVARLLGAASAVDPVIQREVMALPADFSFAMRVRAGGAGMAMRRSGDRLRAIDPATADAFSLVFEFKHLTHAFLVLGFVESTARSFANDRIAVDGDIALGMKLVRCLNRMEAVVLPKIVAVRAVKTYPEIGIARKLTLALRVYGRMVLDLLRGNRP